jgi:hypothetical protein
MQPYIFNPWAWRDPSLLTGGRVGDADRREADRREADRRDADRGGVDDTTAGAGPGAELVGYHVEATDGGIGSVDEASFEVDSAHLVVDTGPWIFGRKVLLPAGTVQRVDHDERKVYVDRTKDQIKNSPEYDEATFRTPAYRERVGTYYTASYRDYPPLM